MGYIHEFCDCKLCSHAHFSEVTECEYCNSPEGLYFRECKHFTIEDRRSGLTKLVQKLGDYLKVKYGKWQKALYLKTGYLKDRVFNGVRIDRKKEPALYSKFKFFEAPPYPLEYERKEDNACKLSEEDVLSDIDRGTENK